MRRPHFTPPSPQEIPRYSFLLVSGPQDYRMRADGISPENFQGHYRESNPEPPVLLRLNQQHHRSLVVAFLQRRLKWKLLWYSNRIFHANMSNLSSTKSGIMHEMQLPKRHKGGVVEIQPPHFFAWKYCHQKVKFKFRFQISIWSDSL